MLYSGDRMGLLRVCPTGSWRFRLKQSGTKNLIREQFSKSGQSEDRFDITHSHLVNKSVTVMVVLTLYTGFEDHDL